MLGQALFRRRAFPSEILALAPIMMLTESCLYVSEYVWCTSDDDSLPFNQRWKDFRATADSPSAAPAVQELKEPEEKSDMV